MQNFGDNTFEIVVKGAIDDKTGVFAEHIDNGIEAAPMFNLYHRGHPTHYKLQQSTTHLYLATLVRLHSVRHQGSQVVNSDGRIIRLHKGYEFTVTQGLQQIGKVVTTIRRR